MATSNIMAILPFVLMFIYFVAAAVINVFRILKRDESMTQFGPCNGERNNPKRDSYPVACCRSFEEHRCANAKCIGDQRLRIKPQ